jgi:peptidoglycan/xylan/chitin deacetylase (PgdA/CDA1 family)
MKPRIASLLLAALLFTAALAMLLPVAEAATPGTNIYSLPTTQKVVALTFDDAWIDSYMVSILNTLSAGGVKATFFPTGSGVSASPALAARALAEGHDLGSHGYYHTWMPSLTNDAIISNVQKTERALALVGARTPSPLFRTPYTGGWNTRVLGVLKTQGYANVLWNINSNDADPYMTPSKLIYGVMNRLKPGAIILMHSRYPSTVQALPELIRQIKAKGYGIVLLRDYLCSAQQNVPLYQQAHPAFTYSGGWATMWSSAFSAGSVMFAATPDKTITFSFAGPYLELIGTVGPRYGLASLSIDGAEAQVVSYYRSWSANRFAVFRIDGLSEGSHTAVLTTSKGAVNLDAVKVFGPLTASASAP